jgi:hypothetical protein
MTQRALEQVRQRARTDPDFRSQLETNPRPVLAPYDLTVAEMTTLMGLIANGELWAQETKARTEPRPHISPGSRPSVSPKSQPSASMESRPPSSAEPRQ